MATHFNTQIGQAGALPGDGHLELLVVADDDQARRRIRESLESLDREVVVHEAVTARGATEALARRRFDCALVDAELPDSSGAELIRGASALPGWRRRSTPFVLMGDEHDVHALDSAVRNGAEDLLPRKGLDGVGLIRSIRFAMERKRSQTLVEEANDKLDRLVTLDPLTELPNRRAFERYLKARAIDAVQTGADQRMFDHPGGFPGDLAGERPVVILIDVDDLKEINERFGLDVGDQALRWVARAVERAVPVGTFVARVGGDEFAVLLQPDKTPSALAAGERIRMDVAALAMRWREQPVPIFVSVGAAVVPAHAATVSAVLGFAQRALDRSKHQGKNRVSLADLPLADESLPASGGRTVTVDSDTFEQRNLRTWRQPIVRLSDGRSMGYEFCTRGQAGKLESPLDLLTAAAARDDLATVDLRFLRRAVLQATRLPRRMRSHLNVRAETLLEVPPEVIYEALLAGPEPDNVYLELEIKDLELDLDDLALRVDSLRRCGIGLVVDGLGGGRSSLEALLALRPEWVGLSPNVGPESLARLLGVLDKLGCHAVAKGVETAEQACMLADAGVRLAQGWFFGRPAPCDLD